jgi:tRNA pseudouridine38-40 synthase
MATYRLLVEYDGSRYRGWQEQTNARTVAGELKVAIERVAGPVTDLGGSGRTDAGVHAAAQTAHLRIARAMDPENLREAVNEQLPHDIHLLAATIAPERFHARHAAVSRSYVYQIATCRPRSPSASSGGSRPLDAELMAPAAAASPASTTSRSSEARGPDEHARRRRPPGRPRGGPDPRTPAASHFL